MPQTTSSSNPEPGRPQATGWRSPIVLLMLMAVAMQLSFQTWMTLLNNFAIHEVKFTGREIGILQSVREIPGFLSFGVVFVLLFMREQTLTILALLTLAAGTALTGFFPSSVGFFATTLLMSVGFHYYEATAQSLALQWLPKTTAAVGLSRIVAVRSFAAIGAFLLIYLTWDLLGLQFRDIYLIGAGLTVLIVVFIWFAFPYFRQEVKQHRHIVLRKRYWLFYALTFLAGARRQIFVVFAAFMMVEKFGYSVTSITTLYLVNHVITIAIAPMCGRMIHRFGERAALVFEYAGLALIFTAYAFVESAIIAAVLYIFDHAFFALRIAVRTYFQKIADPADIAPSSGVSFTINHIAAVGLPVVLGMVWLQSPAAVFLIGTALAVASMILAILVPRMPEPGNEVAWRSRQLKPAE